MLLWFFIEATVFGLLLFAADATLQKLAGRPIAFLSLLGWLGIAWLSWVIFWVLKGAIA